MHSPKKLKLPGALKAIEKPLARLGDLIYVQFDIGITGGGADYPHQMRSMFAPGMKTKDKRFPLQASELQLRDLYASGGWIESLDHFTDEELAIYYQYRAGFPTKSGYAHDVGDPSAYEVDYMEVLESMPKDLVEGAQRARTLEVIRRTLLHQHLKYKLHANLGKTHKVTSSVGGQATGQAKKASSALWQEKCANEARLMIARGVSPRDIGAKLAARFAKSTRQISNVLKAAGVK